MAEAKTTEERTLAEIKQAYIQLEKRHSEARKNSVRTLEFAKGNSWDEATIARLEKAHLPYLKLNIMLPILLRVFGAERQRRGKLAAVPLRNGSMEIAQIFTEIFDWIESHSKTSEHIGDAFKMSVICDRPPWLRVRYTTEYDPLGMPVIEYVSPFYVYEGPSETKDLRDCREIIVSYFLTKEEIEQWVEDKFGSEKKEKLKEKLTQDRRSLWQQWSDGISHLTGAKKHLETDFVDEKNGRYRIIERYLKRTEKEYVAHIDNKPQKVSQTLAATLNQEGGRVIEKSRDVITITTTVGDLMVLQDETPLPVQNGQFPLFPVWGLNLDGENIGLGRQLEGPQEEYQKARSAELHILGKTAAGGWQAMRGSLNSKEIEKIEKYGSAPGYVQFYEAGYERPIPIAPQIPPSAQINRSQEAKNDLQFISSVGENPLGRRDSSGESGKLFNARVEEFLSTLQEFFSNLLMAEERAGKYVVDMVQELMTEERVLTIADTGQEIEINQEISGTGLKINDISVGKYGVKTEIAPTTQVARRAMVDVLLQTLQYSQPEVHAVILKGIFKKHDQIDEQTRQEIISELEKLRPPSPAEQVQAQQTLAQLEGVAA